MKQPLPPVITIDGPGGVGKGTLAKLIARHLDWRLLDSGVLYRAVAWAAFRDQIDVSNHHALENLLIRDRIEMCIDVHGKTHVMCDGQDITEAIRTKECSTMASIISAIPLVRTALLQHQRNMRQFPGLVADGRDMGTVIFPDANIKFFLTATSQERAQRRHKQLKGMGINVSLRDILQEIEERDDRDAHRAIAPLKPAADAVIIDTTHLSVSQVLERVMTTMQEVLNLECCSSHMKKSKH